MKRIAIIAALLLASIFSFAQTGDESTFIYLDGKMNREDLENILAKIMK